jgi:hypothetical protein
MGGSAEDEGGGIAVDTSGNAYVTGETHSSNFPTTSGAFETTLKGGQDVFVTKLNAAGSAMLYSTYLGGSGGEVGRGIAVDASGNAYVSGFTNSGDFPVTPGAFQATSGGDADAFVIKLNATGSTLIYSTYPGGSAADGDFDGGGGNIAIDAAGNAYVTGHTTASDFPTTQGAFQTVCGGCSPAGVVGDAFVTKLNLTGSALVYSTFLGGGSDEGGNGIAIDASGNAYISGSTTSSNFPTTTDAFQTALGGNGFGDAFFSKLNAAGSALLYSTYLGGNNIDNSNGIAVDAAGSAYVAGYSFSSNFPTTSGAFQTTFRGTVDAFVSKFSFGSADLFLRVQPSTTTVHQGDLLTYAFPVWNLGPDNADLEVLNTQVPAGTTFDYIRISGTPGLGRCTTPPYQGTGQIICHENASIAPNTTWTVRLTVKVTAPAGTVITENAATMADTPDPNLANNTATVSIQVR